MAYDPSRCEVHTAPSIQLPEGHYSLIADVVDREHLVPTDAAQVVGYGQADGQPAEVLPDTDIE